MIHAEFVGFTGFQPEANMEIVEPTTFYHPEVGESSLVRDGDFPKCHAYETSKLSFTKNCLDNFIKKGVFGTIKPVLIYRSGVPLMNV